MLNNNSIWIILILALVVFGGFGTNNCQSGSSNGCDCGCSC